MRIVKVKYTVQYEALMFVEDHATEQEIFEATDEINIPEDKLSQYIPGTYDPVIESASGMLNNIELNDGGWIEPPNSDGEIWRYDVNGNCEEIRSPSMAESEGDDLYKEWLNLFLNQ